jgi:hypothetical protein
MMAVHHAPAYAEKPEDPCWKQAFKNIDDILHKDAGARASWIATSSDPSVPRCWLRFGG